MSLNNHHRPTVKPPTAVPSRDLLEISTAATAPRPRPRAFCRGNAEAMLRAAEALEALERGEPVATPPGVILNPTREEIEAGCREIGVDPPVWPIPKGGWRSRIFMSVVMLSRVWKQSKTRRNELLVMLALADFANDAGQAWPSVSTLAKKARLSERETHYVLRQLKHSRELKIERNKGPHGCNLYTLKITEPGGASCAGVQSVQGAKNAGGVQIKHVLGVHTGAPKPSVPRQVQEPSLSPGHFGLGQNSGEPAEPSARPSARDSSRSILNKDAEVAFTEFWEAYPRKTHKLAAQRAWAKQKPPLGKCLQTLAALKTSRDWRKEAGRFIPHPASWLNGGGWDDELPTNTNAKRPSTHAPPPPDRSSVDPQAFRAYVHKHYSAPAQRAWTLEDAPERVVRDYLKDNNA